MFSVQSVQLKRRRTSGAGDFPLPEKRPVCGRACIGFGPLSERSRNWLFDGISELVTVGEGAFAGKPSFGHSTRSCGYHHARGWWKWIILRSGPVAVARSEFLVYQPTPDPQSRLHPRPPS